MRSLFFLFPSLVFSIAALAQSDSSATNDSIPNGNFEYWTGNTADDWTSNPSLVFPTYFEHSGFLGAEGIVAIDDDTAPTLSIKFPIRYRPGIFDGYYQVTSVGGDEIMIFAAILSNGNPGGEAMLVDSISSPDWEVWKHFQLPIMYPLEELPDSAFLLITLQNPNGKLHYGTSFLLDDLRFLDTAADRFVSVEKSPLLRSTISAYPNPISSQATLHLSLAKAGYATISIFNTLGTEVSRIFDGELSAGEYSFQWNVPAARPSGMYECVLTLNGLRQSIPLIVE